MRDWSINIFEEILGMTADEWKELNDFINEGDDK